MNATLDRAPMGRMLMIFLGILIATNLALAAIGYVFPDLPIPSSMGIVLAMVAAMSSGQSGAKAVNRRLQFREKAIFAVLATLLSVVFGIGMLWAIFVYFGIPFSLENTIIIMTGGAAPDGQFREILVWVAPIVLVIYVLITYLGAAMGARNQIKLQERLAAKGK